MGFTLEVAFAPAFLTVNNSAVFRCLSHAVITSFSFKFIPKFIFKPTQSTLLNILFIFKLEYLFLVGHRVA